jgi:hypothetical protein
VGKREERERKEGILAFSQIESASQNIRDNRFFQKVQQYLSRITTIHMAPMSVLKSQGFPIYSISMSSQAFWTPSIILKCSVV